MLTVDLILMHRSLFDRNRTQVFYFVSYNGYTVVTTECPVEANAELNAAKHGQRPHLEAIDTREPPLVERPKPIRSGQRLYDDRCFSKLDHSVIESALVSNSLPTLAEDRAAETSSPGRMLGDLVEHIFTQP